MVIVMAHLNFLDRFTLYLGVVLDNSCSGKEQGKDFMNRLMSEWHCAYRAVTFGAHVLILWCNVVQCGQ